MAVDYERVILELRIGGMRWLVSDRTGTLTDDGQELHVLPGLPEELPDQEIDLFGVTEVPSLVVEGLRLPGLSGLTTDLPVNATLVAVGTTSTWQQRRPLLVLRAESWSRTPDERITTELLADSTPEDLATWPPATATMSPSTWPIGVGSTQRSTDGAAYPVPFGSPGVYLSSDGTTLTTLASPAYNIDPATAANRVLLIAADPVSATTVQVTDPTDGTTATGTVSNTLDDLGRRVAIATVPALDPILPLADRTYYLTWNDGPGAIGETSRGAVYSAADLCLYLLRRSAVRIDRPRWRALEDHLGEYKLAGCIEAAVQPWTYLLDAVLPLLPLSIVMGPDGWRPILYRYEWPASEARAHLQVQPGELYEPIARDVVGQITPTIRLSWAYDAEEDAFRETMSCVGDPDQRAAGVHTSAYTVAAYSRWLASLPDPTTASLQEPPSYDLETDLVYDRPTAAAIVGWLAAARALPARRITYPCSPSVRDLDPGDRLLLTDETSNLTRVPVIVERLPLARRSAPTITLRTLPTPLLPSYL